jgi:hypothetical protein
VTANLIGGSTRSSPRSEFRSDRVLASRKLLKTLISNIGLCLAYLLPMSNQASTANTLPAIAVQAVVLQLSNELRALTQELVVVNRRIRTLRTVQGLLISFGRQIGTASLNKDGSSSGPPLDSDRQQRS